MSATETRRIRPRDANILLKHCMNKRRPVFLWGPPGIGKSEIVEGIGEEQKRPIIDMRLLLMEPTDVKGIPFYNPDKAVMEWAKPSELPARVNIDAEKEALAELQKDFEKFKALGDATLKELAEREEIIAQLDKLIREQNAILFLDELNSAPPAVQAAAYQLILNYRVGAYHLPKGVSIIAAGNRETDKGVTFRMPSPLANRFVHLELEANFEDWQKWALNHDINADVVGFLSHHKQHLFTFDPKSTDKAFATPRTWVFVSDLLDDTLPEHLNTVLVAGTVGNGLASEFSIHRRVASKLPKPEDILLGKATEIKTKEISAMYSSTISMCYTLKEWLKNAQDPEDKKYTLDNWHDNVYYFFQFMMDNFGTEMIVLGAKTALRDYQLPIDHRKLKNFSTFHKKYGSYILDD